MAQSSFDIINFLQNPNKTHKIVLCCGGSVAAVKIPEITVKLIENNILNNHNNINCNKHVNIIILTTKTACFFLNRCESYYNKKNQNEIYQKYLNYMESNQIIFINDDSSIK